MKINVINITRNGVKNDPVQMELEHYLKAKKVQPDRWEPADKNAEKLVARIPMDAVPIGTTMNDVQKFEDNRGKNTAKGKSRFEMLLKAAESGTDIVETSDDVLDHSQTIANLKSEQAPADYQSKADPVIGEMDGNGVIKVFGKSLASEKVSKFDKESLMKLTMDKLQAIVEQEISDGKKKELLLKTKKKVDLVDSIIQLTKK